MKNKIALTLMALGLTLPAINLNAQDGPRPPRGDGPRPPLPPLVVALDVNHDGVIDTAELNAAPEALRSLDKNNDGKLTPDELRPAGPKPAGDQPDHPRPPREQAAGDGAPAGGRPPGPPIIAALDVNKDGVIDATEISNATAALKSLDKNGDGQLTRDEIHPAGPRGPRGPKGKAHPQREGAPVQ
jgi:hypothetical protein